MRRLIAERVGEIQKALVLDVIVGDVEQLQVKVVLQHVGEAFCVVGIELVVGEAQLFECAILVECAA